MQPILQAFTGDNHEADNDESLTALTFERHAIGLRIGDIRTISCQKASPKLKFCYLYFIEVKSNKTLPRENEFLFGMVIFDFDDGRFSYFSFTEVVQLTYLHI